MDGYLPYPQCYHPLSGISPLMDEHQDNEEFERAAALAVCHGHLPAAVAALARGADVIKDQSSEGEAYSEGNMGVYVYL